MQNNNEDKILVAKILDKQKECKVKNKLSYSDFLNEKDVRIIQKNINLENCFFDGAIENADRKILIFYPEKLTEQMAKKNINKIFSIIRIELPKEMYGKYEHRNYLSALIKIGLVREKIGDILVFENGADIICFQANKDYIINSLYELTRFKKSKINEISFEELREKKENFFEFTVIVSSIRLDNIVAELAKTSRNKAEELLKNERVLVNYEIVEKSSKILKIGDIITIRGKGKFIIDGLVRNTRNDRLVINIKKYA